jgi:hypothetical protein
MDFELKRTLLTPLMTGLCGLCFIGSAAVIVSQNLQKEAQVKQQQAQAQALQESREVRNKDRAFALSQVAKEYRINNCWIRNETFTVDLVVPPLKNGKIPSTCLVRENRSQYAYLAEYNGALRIQYVFTPTELTNALSNN